MLKVSLQIYDLSFGTKKISRLRPAYFFYLSIEGRGKRKKGRGKSVCVKREEGIAKLSRSTTHNSVFLMIKKADFALFSFYVT